MKSHNRTLLLYHLVFPAKYRRKVFTPNVAETLKEVSIGIEDCGYGIRFVEIGMEEDHVQYFGNQNCNNNKNITVREIFKQYPQIKKEIL